MPVETFHTTYFLAILRTLTKEGISHKMLKTSTFAVLAAFAIFFLFTGK
jgi:hypothetical protein